MELLEEVTHTHKTHACSYKSLNRKLPFFLHWPVQLEHHFNINVNFWGCWRRLGWQHRYQASEAGICWKSSKIIRFSEHDNGHVHENHHKPSIWTITLTHNCISTRLEELTERDVSFHLRLRLNRNNLMWFWLRHHLFTSCRWSWKTLKMVLTTWNTVRERWNYCPKYICSLWRHSYHLDKWSTWI